MRIISGKFKNKTILLPTDKNTRPLRDMVKESIFNILKHSNLFQNEISNSSDTRSIFRIGFFWT